MFYCKWKLFLILCEIFTVLGFNVNNFWLSLVVAHK